MSNDNAGLQRPSPPSLSFSDWLRQIPTIYGLLTVALAAVAGLLIPRSELLIPHPLAESGFPNILGSLVVLVAFILTWAYSKKLVVHQRRVALVTVLSLIVFIGLNAYFVRPVSFNSQERIHVLAGVAVADPEEPNDIEYVVHNYGASWGALHDAYGWDFDAVAISYLFVYTLLLMSIILSIGGSGFARPSTIRKKSRHVGR